MWEYDLGGSIKWRTGEGLASVVSEMCVIGTFDSEGACRAPWALLSW